MKKSKLLTSLVGLTGLSMGLVPTIASCSCSNSKYSVTQTTTLNEKIFNKKSGGCTWNFKLDSDELAKVTKVKLINLKVNGADTASVSGLIKYRYDSAGNISVVVNTNTLLKQWPEATKFEFSLQFTNKETKEVVVIDGFILNLDDSIEFVEIATCDWPVFLERVSLYYDGSITAEEFAKTFYKNDQQEPAQGIEDLIGMERELTLNGYTHNVRIVGVEHDDLADGSGKALLTFDSFSLIMDSSGYVLQTKWDETNNNTYHQSTLYNALNSTQPFNGWAQIGLGKKAGGTYKNESVYTQLSNYFVSLGVENPIKQVTKQETIKVDGSWKPNNYNCYCFSLSATELNLSHKYAPTQEGTTYAYYQSSPTYCKTDLLGTCRQYWTPTPHTYSSTNAYYVYFNNDKDQKTKTLSGNSITGTTNVSFAFCI